MFITKIRISKRKRRDGVNDSVAACHQAGRGSNLDVDKSFEKLEKQLTGLTLEGGSSRCALTRALRADTSGRRRYEKWPGRGFEKESVFFLCLEGSSVTSGATGAAVDVEVDGALEASPPDVRWS